jgi:hypothetical protein
MRIIVNHLTRMQAGYICVAGVDVATGRHVRPVVQHRMGRSLLRRNGGPFDLGAVVDLGQTIAVGEPPSMEDHSFTPAGARRVKDASPDYFWRLLERVARDNLAEIFGDRLERHGRTLALDAHTGVASLGVLRPAATTLQYDPASGKLRLQLGDGDDLLSLSVTDLRLFEQDQVTPRQFVVDEIASRLSRGVGVLLSVGLTRLYRALGDSAHRHYLQANNIHLEDDSLMQEYQLP